MNSSKIDQLERLNLESLKLERIIRSLKDEIEVGNNGSSWKDSKEVGNMYPISILTEKCFQIPENHSN